MIRGCQNESCFYEEMGEVDELETNICATCQDTFVVCFECLPEYAVNVKFGPNANHDFPIERPYVVNMGLSYLSAFRVLLCPGCIDTHFMDINSGGVSCKELLHTRRTGNIVIR